MDIQNSNMHASAVSVRVQLRPAYWRRTIMTSTELGMGKWRKVYFGLAIVSAIFLLETFHPFF
jgi:hypothetical protein